MQLQPRLQSGLQYRLQWTVRRTGHTPDDEMKIRERVRFVLSVDASEVPGLFLLLPFRSSYREEPHRYTPNGAPHRPLIAISPSFMFFLTWMLGDSLDI